MERDQPAVARRLQTMTTIGIGLFIGLAIKIGTLQSRVDALEAKACERTKQHADARDVVIEEVSP